MPKVLLIDDNAPFLAMQELVLRKAGYDVVTASNGKEGLQRIQLETFDLVVTDLVMPEKEGIEVIMELRRCHPGLKVIAISGGGRVGPGNYLHMAGKLGAVATLEKPFTAEQLIAAIATALAR